MSQPNNPYAPPSSVDAGAKTPAPAATREFAMRRGWRAFGIWLACLSILIGVSASFIQAVEKTGAAKAASVIARFALLNGPRFAVMSACLGAAVFAHHRRVRDMAMGPMFTVAPAASFVSSAITWVSGSIAMMFMYGSSPREILSGTVDAFRLFEIGIAFASSCAYALFLAPLAVFALPVLTTAMPTRWIRFFVVWSLAVSVIKGIDGVLGPLMGTGNAE